MWGLYTNLLRLTITDPKAAARYIFAQDIERRNLWIALAVIVCVTVALITIGEALTPPPPEGQVTIVDLFAPIPLAMLFMGAWAITVACTYYIGRGFGGTGSFDNSLKTVIWLEVIQTSLLILQLLLILTVPLLSLFLSVVALVLIVRCYILFVTELHGFASPPLVFAGMVVSGFAVLFVVAIMFGILATILGIEVQNV